MRVRRAAHHYLVKQPRCDVSQTAKMEQRMKVLLWVLLSGKMLDLTGKTNRFVCDQMFFTCLLVHWNKLLIFMSFLKLLHVIIIFIYYYYFMLKLIVSVSTVSFHV